MDEHKERAFLYRQRAEELRAIAEDIKDANNRKVLVQIADDYDRLARIQDHLAGDKPHKS